jgi:D-3-phosphoglycerate dehydrogenase
MTGAGVEPVSLEELLERADIVSLHTPLNDETRHLMNAGRFARMKPGAVFVNTGRGPCVDEAALVAALERGHLAVAALDVLEEEPPRPDHPLLRLPNVILTPHVASATSRMMPETRRRLGREIALVLRGYWPRSCVNPGVLPRLPLERWQPYPMERGPNR